MKCVERGNLTGLPGTETTVMLYPYRLGSRMRLSTSYMIEKRTLSGGRTSMSRRLAEALAAEYGLHISEVAGGGVNIYGLNKKAVKDLRQLVLADFTAHMLGSMHYLDHYKRVHEENLANIQSCKPMMFVKMYDHTMACKVQETLDQHTTNEIIARTQDVVAMLDGSEPIQLISF